MIQTYWKPFVAGVVGIGVGLALFYLVRTLYVDHVVLRQIVDMINAQAAQAAKAAK